MSRYLFALTDAGGTVPPELGTARRLVARGHTVTVLGDATMAEAAARAGVRFQPWTIPAEPVKDWGIQSPMAKVKGMVGMLIGPAPGHARDTAAAIEELDPDGVVASTFTIGAMAAAEAASKPFDLLIPNLYALPAPGMPPFGLGLRPARGPLGRVRDRVITGTNVRVFDRYTLPPVNEVRRGLGLSELTTTWDQLMRARRQLVLTSAAFDFPAQLPPIVRYCGPVLDDPAWAGGEWTPPDGEGPLVVVAMSSTFQDHADCLQRIADAIDAAGVRGLVTTGPAIEPSAIRGGPRVQVVRSAPHNQVFSHADLVVTHGGHGTVMKALAADAPMVVMHHGRDQADNATRLTERGAAIAISRRSSSKKIARAIRQVLESDRYRGGAARLGAAVRADASTDVLETELEALAGG